MQSSCGDIKVLGRVLAPPPGGSRCPGGHRSILRGLMVRSPRQKPALGSPGVVVMEGSD